MTRVESGGEVNFMGVLSTRVEEGVVLSLNSQGTVRSVNQAFTDMFGYSSSETVGRPFVELLRLRDTKEVVKLVAGISRGKVKETERSFEAKHNSGTIFPISVTFSADTVRNAARARAPRTRRAAFCLPASDIQSAARFLDLLREVVRGV